MRNLSHDEFLAVLCARQIRNGERITIGVSSPIPTAGAKLAQLLHAPDTWYSVDGMMKRFLRGSYETTGLALCGKIDLFYFSAVQIDAEANFNLQYIGDPDRPKKRFLGAFAAPVYYPAMKRSVLLCNRHDTRVFVPRLDYVTAVAGNSPRHRRIGGPDKVITPLSVLSYNRKSDLLELESSHPGVEVDRIRESTGFKLPLAENYHVTPLPSDEEEETMLGQVRSWMAGHYPNWEKPIPPAAPLSATTATQA